MPRSLSESRRFPGPPYVISDDRLDDVLSFAHGSQARVVRVEVPTGPDRLPDRRELLRRLGAALGFPDWFGANWDAWDDCLGELIDTGEGGIVVVLDRAERLLSSPAVFAEFAYQLQRTSDQTAAEAGGRFGLEFVFSGSWPAG